MDPQPLWDEKSNALVLQLYNHSCLMAPFVTHNARAVPVVYSLLLHICRAMRCISAAYAVMRCLCVCPSVCLFVCVSVTFMNCVKKNKDIFEIFHHRVAKPF